jgi:hypothetical protein
MLTNQKLYNVLNMLCLLSVPIQVNYSLMHCVHKKSIKHPYVQTGVNIKSHFINTMKPAKQEHPRYRPHVSLYHRCPYVRV